MAEDDQSSPERATRLVLQKLPVQFWWASLGLYALALTQDGFYIGGNNPRAWSPGWGELIAGWVSVMEGTSAWLANPLLFIGWITYRSSNRSVPLMCASAAFILAVSFLGVKRVVVSEAPTFAQVTGYGAGYWFWVLSALSLLVANLARLWGARFRPSL